MEKNKLKGINNIFKGKSKVKKVFTSLIFVIFLMQAVVALASVVNEDFDGITAQIVHNTNMFNNDSTEEWTFSQDEGDAQIAIAGNANGSTFTNGLSNDYSADRVLFLNYNGLTNNGNSIYSFYTTNGTPFTLTSFEIGNNLAGYSLDVKITVLSGSTELGSGTFNLNTSSVSNGITYTYSGDSSAGSDRPYGILTFDSSIYTNVTKVKLDYTSAATPLLENIIIDPNNAPLITGTPDTTVDIDSNYSFIPTATDVDVGDTRTFSITNKPSWASFNTTTGELSGTPTNSDEGTTSNIVITVTDALGASSSLSAFNLTVHVNAPPVLAAISDEYVYSNTTSKSITLSATDTDSAGLTYSAIFTNTNLINNISFSGNNMTIYFNDDITGESDIEVSVSDGQDSSSKTFTFKVIGITENGSLKENGEISVDSSETYTVNFSTDNITVVAQTQEDTNGKKLHKINLNGTLVQSITELTGSVVELITSGVHTTYSDSNVSLEVSANINGEAVHTLTSNGETIKATSKIIGAQTTIKKDTNNKVIVQTDVDLNSNAQASIIAQEDGTAQHTVTYNSKSSKATSNISNIVTLITSSGNVETSAGNVASSDVGYTIKALVITNASGESITRFIKVNDSDETDVQVIENTVNVNTPFSLGTQSSIEEINGKLYLSVKTQLDNNLEIE